VGTASITKDEAGDWRSAEEGAKVALAQNILTEITSEVTSENSEYSHGSQRDLVSRVTSRNTLGTSLAIPGIVVADRWNDKEHRTRYCFVSVAVHSVHAFQERCFDGVRAYIDAEGQAMAELPLSTAYPAYVDRAARLLVYASTQSAAPVFGVAQRAWLSAAIQSVRSQLATVLANLQFRIDPVSRQPARQRIDVSVRLVATYLDQALVGLPVSASFVEGKGFGQAQGRAESASDGTIALAVCQINSVRPDNTIEIVPALYDALPDSVLKVIPPLPPYRVVIPSYDPRQEVQCQVAYITGSNRIDVAPVVSRVAGQLRDEGYPVSEAAPRPAPSPVDVPQLLGDKATGVWVILDVRLSDTAVEDGSLVWQVDVVWTVLNLLARESAPNTSGTIQLRVAGASEAELLELVRDQLYTKLAGAVKHAVDDSAL
jgi:hypothetical protein